MQRAQCTLTLLVLAISWPVLIMAQPAVNVCPFLQLQACSAPRCVKGGLDCSGGRSVGGDAPTPLPRRRDRPRLPQDDRAAVLGGVGGPATHALPCATTTLVPAEGTQGWARRPGPAPRCLRVGPPPTLRVFCTCRARAVELEAALAWDSSLTLAFTARVVRGKDQVSATITVPEEGGYAKAQALATLITPFGTKSFGRQGKVRCGGGGSGGGVVRVCVRVWWGGGGGGGAFEAHGQSQPFSAGFKSRQHKCRDAVQGKWLACRFVWHGQSVTTTRPSALQITTTVFWGDMKMTPADRPTAVGELIPSFLDALNGNSLFLDVR